MLKKCDDENWEVKFLNRGMNSNFHWPKTDQLEAVEPKQFICGPLKITGMPPFHIQSIDKVRLDYLKYRKTGRGSINMNKAN